MRLNFLWVGVASALLLGVGCSADTGGGGRGVRDSGRTMSDAAPMDSGVSVTEIDALSCADLVDNDMDGFTDCADPGCAAFCGPAPDGGPPVDSGFTECSSESVVAETGFAPIDIIWVIDSSGSMGGEARIVQDNLNTFSTAIGGSGLDVHVVVITTSSFVTVPPPLGSDAMRFLFVEAGVGSSAALDQLIAQYPRYQDFLRPDAVTHIVGVTDDESGLGGGAFQSMMEGLLGHTFRFHTIASPPGSTHCDPILCVITDDGCTGPNGDAADNGDTYCGVSSATGGLTFSICTADWSGLFTTLSTTIATPTPLPCRFSVPAPPDGMDLDLMKVNVTFTPSDGSMPQTFPFVGDFGSCAGQGWYYEGAPGDPDSIVVCPATCSTLEADTTGRVDIAIGCATIII